MTISQKSKVISCSKCGKSVTLDKIVDYFHYGECECGQQIEWEVVWEDDI